jgi:hypothetical protein
MESWQLSYNMSQLREPEGGGSDAVLEVNQIAVDETGRAEQTVAREIF